MPEDSRVGLSISLAVLVLSATGCERSEAAPPIPPARVERASREVELGTVILEADAERRLAIGAGLKPVERRAVLSLRTLPGLMLAAPGGQAQVVAPVAGTIALIDSDAPLPGMPVRAGQPMLLLEPILGPADRINLASALADAEGQVARAKVEVETAEVAMRRVEPLVADRALAGRALEEARATLATANATLAAATARRDTIVDSVQSPRLVLASPISGVLRELRVAPGEVVSAGFVCADIVALSPLRVRVAVPRVEVEELDTGRPAGVSPLATDRPEAIELALPLPSPPPTVGLAPGAVDLHYELANDRGAFLPGERVAVQLERRTNERTLVVPWASVVQDALGGQWVYVPTGERGAYARRRVHVLRVEGDAAVLDPTSAVDEATMVVTGGAAELFGIEFGVGQ